MSDVLGWIALSALALLLLFALAVWLSRGGRATKINISGLGMTLSIDSSGSAREIVATKAKRVD